MAESAPTGRLEEGLWPWRGSRKQCQVGLTSFGAVCFSGRRFVRLSYSSAQFPATSRPETIALRSPPAIHHAKELLRPRIRR